MSFFRFLPQYNFSLARESKTLTNPFTFSAALIGYEQRLSSLSYGAALNLEEFTRGPQPTPRLFSNYKRPTAQRGNLKNNNDNKRARSEMNGCRVNIINSVQRKSRERRRYEGSNVVPAARGRRTRCSNNNNTAPTPTHNNTPSGDGKRSTN